MEWIFIVAILIAYFVGRWTVTRKIITVRDKLRPQESKSRRMIARNAVLQLQNEIAETNAVKQEVQEDGWIKVSLRIIK